MAERGTVTRASRLAVDVIMDWRAGDSDRFARYQTSWWVSEIRVLDVAERLAELA